MFDFAPLFKSNCWLIAILSVSKQESAKNKLYILYIKKTFIFLFLICISTHLNGPP